MAQISDIVQEQSYHGDANLGNGYDLPIQIDVKPLNDLARYTMIYNKSKYDENEKKAQDQAKQLAELTAYDLTAIPEEAKQLQGEYDKLYNYVRSNPNVLDYKNNPTGYTDFLKMKNDLNQKVRTAKGRNMVYEKWQSDINNAATPEMKTLLKKQLAENIKSTNIDVPLPAQENYDITPVVYTAPATKTVDATVLGGENGNENIKRKFTVTDMADVDSQTNAIYLGLQNLVKNKDGTPEQKAAYAAQSASGKLLPFLQAETFQEAVAGLPIDAKGNRDYTNAPGLVKGVVSVVDSANKFISEQSNQLSGAKDDFGKPLFGGQSGINPANYTLLDRNNITPEVLIKAQILAKAKSINYDTTVQETNNGIQNEDLKVKWAHLGLEKEKLNKANNQDLLAADGVLREITDIINKGDMPDNQVDVVDGDTGKTKRVFKIGDPTILQKFGNIDKDGTTTNVPDEARYNPKTNEIDLVYFQRDKKGDVKHTQTRGSYIKETKTLNSRTWVNMVSQRTFAGQDRGQVNEILQNVITKNGGDLFKIAKSFNPSEATGQVEDRQPTKAATSGGMTDAQYAEFLKKNGLK